VVDAFPTVADDKSWRLFINQIDTLPLPSRHRMPLRPSPLKSPNSETDAPAGAVATFPYESTDAPFISQIATAPVAAPQNVRFVVTVKISGPDAVLGVTQQDIALSVAVEVSRLPTTVGLHFPRSRMLGSSRQLHHELTPSRQITAKRHCFKRGQTRRDVERWVSLPIAADPRLSRRLRRTALA
jgi:hypothetical protein